MVMNPPTSSPPLRKSSDGPGLTPTPPIDMSAISHTVLFSKIASDLDDQALRSAFSQVFSESQGNLIKDIRLVNKSTIAVLCTDLQAAQTIERDFKAFSFQKSVMSVKLL